MAAVSVISTVLNERHRIDRMVPSLLALDPPAAEIVIVDGGSTDGTWEWLESAAREHPTLRAIRDESCSLKNSPGPISRGRNVAIAAATSDLIACADVGCTYRPDWLERIIAPIAQGTAEYTLGGSCLDMRDPTIWDLASAPFFGVKLTQEAPSKSCTARSMAFTKELWQRVGGFPETAFFGEDTLFDLEARRATKPAFVEQAKAIYRPQYSFAFMYQKFAGYSMSDGILGVRMNRLLRNAVRCVALAIAIAVLPFTAIPFLAVLTLEAYFAFRLDWLFRYTWSLKILMARLLFSIMVPWIVTANQIKGAWTKKNPMNAQNAKA